MLDTCSQIFKFLLYSIVVVSALVFIGFSYALVIRYHCTPVEVEDLRYWDCHEPESTSFWFLWKTFLDITQTPTVEGNMLSLGAFGINDPVKINKSEIPSLRNFGELWENGDMEVVGICGVDGLAESVVCLDFEVLIVDLGSDLIKRQPSRVVVSLENQRNTYYENNPTHKDLFRFVTKINEQKEKRLLLKHVKTGEVYPVLGVNSSG